MQERELAARNKEQAVLEKETEMGTLKKEMEDQRATLQGYVKVWWEK